MTTLVYRYGLHAPHDAADVVREQMWLAHRYRNVLVEIERGRRAAERALDSELGSADVLRAAELASAAAEAAGKAVAAHRAKSRKRDESPEMKAVLKAAREAERVALKRLREHRALLKSVCAACLEADKETAAPCPHASPAARHKLVAMDQIKERSNELRNNAYEHSGCYWGQRALATAAADKSFWDSPLYGLDGQPNDPGFARWTGDAAVGLQIIGGLSVDEIHGCQDNRLRLRCPDPRAWSGVVSDRRRYGSTAELSLRVGIDGREPVFARWVCDMDRPLPPGARVLFATVHVRRRGPWSEWSLELTLDVSACPAKLKPATEGGAVAIDIGWRIDGDRLRVAAWADERGRNGTYCLEPDTLRLFARVHELRSQRDLAFNGARLGLSWWAQTGADMPEGLRETIAAMPRWKSPGRLFALWRSWSEQRFDGDERAFDLLTAWRERDQKLWSDESLTSMQVHRRRKDFYRVFAAGLADRYDTIVLEDFDLRSVAKRETLGDKAENEIARSNRVVAATSELTEAIIHAARKRGRTCAKMPCADSTRTCPVCGVVEDRDAAASVRLSCDACGNTWDQDAEGAAPVLLVRWRERSGDAKILATARTDGMYHQSQIKKGAGRQRSKRKAEERRARIETAREAGPNAAE